MPKPSAVVRNPDGSASVRVRAPTKLFALIEASAVRDEISVQREFEHLLRRLERLLTARQFGWLPDHMTDIAMLHARKADAANEAAEDAIIDYSLLYGSTRTKSGFVGVYANGKGFRAMVKPPNGKLQTIGTWPSAERAAWERYLYCQKHNIPYGQIEELMEGYRKRNVFGAISDEQLKHEVIVLHKRINDPVVGVSDEDNAKADEQLRQELLETASARGSQPRNTDTKTRSPDPTRTQALAERYAPKPATPDVFEDRHERLKRLAAEAEAQGKILGIDVPMPED